MGYLFDKNRLKRILTLLILLLHFNIFGQNFPTIIDSLICRLSGNHPVVHLVGEDAVEKTYFFDSLGKNTLIKTQTFYIKENTLDGLELNDRQIRRRYKNLDLPETIKSDSIDLKKNQVSFFYNNQDKPRETLQFHQDYSRISEDTFLVSIYRKYRTNCFFYFADTIVKYIDTFKIFRSDSMNNPIRSFTSTYHIKHIENTIFVYCDEQVIGFSIDLDKLLIKEHSVLSFKDLTPLPKFEILYTNFKNDYFLKSYRIYKYQTKKEIPIISKKKRLKQYKKFHQSFPSDIQLR